MKPFNPKSTVFTNLMLDIIMPAVTPNAWKVLCLALRKTAGWADLSTYSGRKESDVISLSQFMKGCGIKSENTAMEAVNFCIEKGYLLREPEGQSYRYRLNVDYELTSSDIEVVDELTSSKIEVVNQETSSIIEDTNSKLTNSNKDSTTPGKNGDQMKKEEYLKSIEESLMKGMVGLQSGYAHFPEHLIPVVERMERYWHFLPPASARAKSYSFWIQSCDEILTACAEFGCALLDELYKDWRAYLDTHQGVAPFTISSPKSLVNSVMGKAALKRGGNNAPMWKLNDYSRGSQSRLDV